MSYTREQAEEMIKDWNDFQVGDSKLFNSDMNFLDHKFGKQLKVGKWYKNDEFDSKICYQGDNGGFGTWKGIWEIGWAINSDWQPMTNEEVYYFLKSECEKRYKVGDMVRGLMTCRERLIKFPMYEVTSEYFFISNISVLDLNTGEWAGVIKKDPIAEQIEKLEKELETLKTKYNE
jgi:hypothetical protein